MIMKKVIFMVVASLMIATANVEAGNKVNEKKNTADFVIDINMTSLTRALNLKHYQVDDMATASDRLYRNVKYAKSSNPVKQSERLNKALRNNLKVAHKVLDDNQYRAYLKILNSTFMNKGLDKALYYQDLAEN